MVGSLRWGVAVKKPAMRRLVLSVSRGGGAGATALGANVFLRVRCAHWSFG